MRIRRRTSIAGRSFPERRSGRSISVSSTMSPRCSCAMSNPGRRPRRYRSKATFASSSPTRAARSGSETDERRTFPLPRSDLGRRSVRARPALGPRGWPASTRWSPRSSPPTIRVWSKATCRSRRGFRRPAIWPRAPDCFSVARRAFRCSPRRPGRCGWCRASPGSRSAWRRSSRWSSAGPILPPECIRGRTRTAI